MYNLPCENDFQLHEREKPFTRQRLSTYSSFDTEAQGNSEMAFSTNSHLSKHLLIAHTEFFFIVLLPFGLFPFIRTADPF